ncbi:hypothetical protein ABPG77_004014 [Micractinium sp. CCAP 211/92]
MRGWQVVTGAPDAWCPGAGPSDGAALPAPRPAGGALSWPPVISTGLGDTAGRDPVTGLHAATLTAPSRVDHTSPYASPALLRIHHALPSMPNPLALGPQADRLLHELQAQEADLAAAEAHSSGRSDGGHVDAGSLAGRKGGAPPARDPEPATSAYRLRTRSASLRAAWVERPIKEEEEGSDGGQEEALGTAGSGSLAGLDEDPADEGSTGAEDERRRPAARKPARKPAPRAPARAKAGGAKFAAGAAARPAPSVDTEAGDGSDGEGQKKLGRPLAYKGDPDSPELTDAERRKIKRRIANRESARRVRAKRAELLEELQIKVTALTQQNGQLASHCTVMESQRNMLLQQNALLQQKLSQKSEESVSLLNQVFALRRLVAPEAAAQAELACQAEREALAGTPPPHSPLPMQGAGMFVPVTPHAPAGSPGGECGHADDPFSADVQGLNFL